MLSKHDHVGVEHCFSHGRRPPPPLPTRGPAPGLTSSGFWQKQPAGQPRQPQGWTSVTDLHAMVTNIMLQCSCWERSAELPEVPLAVLHW